METYFRITFKSSFRRIPCTSPTMQLPIEIRFSRKNMRQKRVLSGLGRAIREYERPKRDPLYEEPRRRHFFAFDSWSAAKVAAHSDGDSEGRRPLEDSRRRRSRGAAALKNARRFNLERIFGIVFAFCVGKGNNNGDELCPRNGAESDTCGWVR